MTLETFPVKLLASLGPNDSVDSVKHRRIIIVAGMHRSGTSALTRAVNLQGATLPKTLMPAQADNPEGFWESQPIARFNEQRLQAVGLSWHDPRPLDHAQPARWNERSPFADRTRQILQDEFPTDGLVVLKDPRISRLLPLWLNAAREAGFAPSVLLCCRNPLEVAQSLTIRNGITQQRGLMLWLSYMLEAERATRCERRAIVQYGELLEDWRKALSQAYDTIGLDAICLSGEIADAIDDSIRPSRRHHHTSTDQLLQDKAVSPLVKEAWAAFQTCPLPEQQTFDALKKRLGDAWATFASSDSHEMASIFNRTVVGRASQKSAAPGEDGQRRIVLHYHIYRNAGTSVDLALKQNFNEAWRQKEGPYAGWPAVDVALHLSKHPGLVALSSSTALLPTPSIADTTIYPIIFLRHPIDRIRSIYEFERTQDTATEGARIAKETDIEGYINWRMDRKSDRTIKNFQAYRLAFAFLDRRECLPLSEEAMAFRALETLPFIGAVELFAESLLILQAWLRPVFPQIELAPTKADTSRSVNSALEERLAMFKDQVGLTTYERLEAANRLDLSLHERTLERIKQRVPVKS